MTGIFLISGINSDFGGIWPFLHKSSKFVHLANPPAPSRYGVVSPVVFTFLTAEVPAGIDKLAEISALRAKTRFVLDELGSTTPDAERALPKR